jgi:cbb3-type cytochrome oxidase subunit 3
MEAIAEMGTVPIILIVIAVVIIGYLIYAYQQKKPPFNE